MALLLPRCPPRFEAFRNVSAKDTVPKATKALEAR
jgi:hypothetical protein